VEQLAARWVVAFSMLLMAVFSLISLLPSPAGLPGYARFLPIDLSPQQLIDGDATEMPIVRDATDVPLAKVTVESANCRAKPRGNAEKITILYRSQEAEIVGRNEDLKNPWWYIKIPNTSGNCWLWGMTASTTGNIDELPIIK
jgi:hypothetical protein